MPSIRPSPRSTAWIGVLCLGLAAPGFAQTEPTVPPVSRQLETPEAADVTVMGHVLQPAQLAPTPERLDRLSLPPGFSIGIFAEDLVNPRMIALAEDGTLYVTRRSVGDVVMLRDEDGDGRAELRQTVASRPQMHGVAVEGDTVYLTTVAEVYRAARNPDGTLGALERIIDDLPDGGQHPNRMVLPGPDGKLYISVGSTCNACDETNPENATMLRAEPDGSARTIFATGLRNTIGYGFEPDSGAFWGMDHGIDWLGDDEQHEELNHLAEGAVYGWPYIYGPGKFNPQDEPPGGITMEEWAATSTEPVGLYTPHAAPMQMAFYTGDAFPEEYRGDAYVAMRGSWNRKPPSGYEVVRIEFEAGRPVGFEPFVTGFLMEDAESDSGWGHLGRLAGLAQGPDGALYLSDDTNGVIYRIAYDGAPDDGMPAGAPDGITNPEGAEVGMTEAEAPPAGPGKQAGLALTLVEAGGALTPSSAAFAEGAPIPEVHAAEEQDISPQLSWGAGPEGTGSFVILVEDPDAAVPVPPFVHWVAYDIPAEVQMLPEGVPGAPKLEAPVAMFQGANSRGSLGWYGMRPPVGDPPHPYHFQVFALDVASLGLPHGASRAAVVEAMAGHVLAAGALVGTYQRTAPAE